MARNIVIGQRVTTAKIERTKQLRQYDPQRAPIVAGASKKCSGLHFRRQQVIAGFIVDFYCHAAGLVVELDGSVHDEQ